MLETIAIIVILLFLFLMLPNIVGFIWLLLAGALIGWVASVIMKTDGQQGAVANILIGIVGSMLGHWLFAGVLGIGAAGSAGMLDLMGILFGVLGAVVLIFILKALKLLK